MKWASLSIQTGWIDNKFEQIIIPLILFGMFGNPNGICNIYIIP
ncbi:hypothetical protein [Candidatus Endomicrobiellum trichonymphae]